MTKMKNHFRRAIITSAILTITPGEWAAAQSSINLNTSASSEPLASPPNAISNDVSPRVIPGLRAPNPAPARTTPLTPFAQFLRDNGITTHLIYTDWYVSNPSEGNPTGQNGNLGELTAGLDFNLQTLFGVPGAQIHVLENIQMFKANTHFQTQVDDANGALQSLSTPSSNEISVLTYEQKLFSKKLDVEVGRSNPQRYFAVSVCDHLVSCLSPVFAFDDAILPGRFGTWMGRSSFNFTPNVYIQTAMFEENPRAQYHNYRLGAIGDTGVDVLGEIGYNSDFSSAKYPATFEFGGIYNSAHHVDPYYTEYGVSRVAHPKQPALEHAGDGGLLSSGQKVIWRADGGTTSNPQPERLYLYAQAYNDFDPTVPFRFDFHGGLTYAGFIRSNPVDDVSFEFQNTILNNREAEYLTASRAAVGGSHAEQPLNQYDFQFNSHLAMTEWAAIEPTFQYYIHPNSILDPRSPRMPHDGWLAGATLILYLSRYVGLNP